VVVPAPSAPIDPPSVDSVATISVQGELCKHLFRRPHFDRVICSAVVLAG
jgi:hypothetical protein